MRVYSMIFVIWDSMRYLISHMNIIIHNSSMSKWTVGAGVRGEVARETARDWWLEYGFRASPFTKPALDRCHSPAWYAFPALFHTAPALSAPSGHLPLEGKAAIREYHLLKKGGKAATRALNLEPWTKWKQSKKGLWNNSSMNTKKDFRFLRIKSPFLC